MFLSLLYLETESFKKQYIVIMFVYVSEKWPFILSDYILVIFSGSCSNLDLACKMMTYTFLYEW